MIYSFCFSGSGDHRNLRVLKHSFPTRRSSDLKDKSPVDRPAQIQERYACRDIADAAARLACFDREVGELSSADQAREITFTDRETAKKARDRKSTRLNSSH